jgi:hypothetical protein
MTVSTTERDLSRYALAIQQLEQGRSNATGICTLTPSATSTTVPAPNCAANSRVFLFPRSANAAAALATTYHSATANGAFTLTHASNAQTDRVFSFVALG